MPLFDIRGARRALPVATTQPDDAAFSAAARAVVSEHLSVLLGEPVVTVAEKPRAAADLLALDSSGSPVVVQIVARLTASDLLEALDAAGQAARLTRRDLAALHPGGPDRFHAALRELVDAAPAARHQAPSSALGTVRLVIVCAEVEAALLPSVEFLRSGAARVELLHVGLVAGQDGQHLVDVSPLAHGAATSVTAAAVPARVVAARRAVEHALTGALPVVPRAAAQGSGELRSAFGTVAPPAGATAPVPVSPDPDDEAPAYVPVFLDLPHGLPALPARPSDLPPPADDQEVSPALDLLAPPRDPGAVVGPVDSQLAALARELAEPLALVWLRHRRGERFEVVLHPDGSLHTDAGVRYADPTWAASAVSGGTASDGWRVWRAGDHGATLAELRA